MLLQQPTQFDLGAVLPTSAVVGQDEVGVAAVEHGQLAQWVCHCLIGSGYLEEEEENSLKWPKRKYESRWLFTQEKLNSAVLTSFPRRSSLFSRMPQGAIPIAHTFPRDLEEWSFKASPTWRITPKVQTANIAA